MHRELDDRKKSVVGLIIIFALLFLCAGTSYYQSRKTVPVEKPEEIVKEEKEEARVVDPTRPMVALTFDDGPSQYTTPILLALEKYDSVGTFFMVGAQVRQYPETVQKIKEMGCDIGNHSMTHPKLTTIKPEAVEPEIVGTEQNVQAILGHGTSFFRPPYGAINNHIASLAKTPIIMWSVDPRDWENKNSVAISDHILNTVQDGDIVLLHDLYDTTVQAVIDVIPKLIDRGYQLVTVSEMAKARGISMENGIKYGHFKHQQQ